MSVTTFVLQNPKHGVVVVDGSVLTALGGQRAEIEAHTTAKGSA